MRIELGLDVGVVVHRAETVDDVLRVHLALVVRVLVVQHLLAHSIELHPVAAPRNSVVKKAGRVPTADTNLECMRCDQMSVTRKVPFVRARVTMSPSVMHSDVPNDARARCSTTR